jgi:hypothetical protein
MKIGGYKKIAEFHGKYGTAVIKQETPSSIDALTLGLFYKGDYAVISPSGSTTFHKDLQSAIERARKASGQK